MQPARPAGRSLHGTLSAGFAAPLRRLGDDDGVLDAAARRALTPPLAVVARGLVRVGVRAAALTAAGWLVGVVACVLAAISQWTPGLVAWLRGHLLDGLDGPVARRTADRTDGAGGTGSYTATLLGVAFANLDVEHEAIARTLGAGPVRVLLTVTLPLLLFSAIGSSDRTAAAALGLVVVLPPVVLVVVAARLLGRRDTTWLGLARG